MAMTRTRYEELRELVAKAKDFIHGGEDYVTAAPLWQAGDHQVAPLTFDELSELFDMADDFPVSSFPPPDV
jgi:hypothetical protein